MTAPPSPTVHVACAANDAYVPHSAAMLASLFRVHAARDVVVHFLHGPLLDPTVLGLLRAMVIGAGAAFVSHRIPDPAVAALPVMGRIPKEMWYRLFLPERLTGIERVLYLDCDTIVLDDVTPLWRTDLTRHALAAVNNVFEEGKERHAAGLGLAHPDRYFNSGVLLINLDAWRQERYSERTLALAGAADSRLTWPDQDALNVVLADRWIALHPRWNCQNSLFYYARAAEVFGKGPVREATTSPGILHFEGGLMAKPWHYLCRHPYRGAYFDSRRATPWPQVAIDGASAFHRLIRPLPMPVVLSAIKWRNRVRKALASL